MPARKAIAVDIDIDSANPAETFGSSSSLPGRSSKQAPATLPKPKLSSTPSRKSSLPQMPNGSPVPGIASRKTSLTQVPHSSPSSILKQSPRNSVNDLTAL